MKILSGIYLPKVFACQLNESTKFNNELILHE